jgi:hypothetical protein
LADVHLSAYWKPLKSSHFPFVFCCLFFLFFFSSWGGEQWGEQKKRRPPMEGFCAFRAMDNFILGMVLFFSASGVLLGLLGCVLSFGGGGPRSDKRTAIGVLCAVGVLVPPVGIVAGLFAIAESRSRWRKT